MRKEFLLFLVSGIISVITQTVLLRELMIEVNGNEIVFSICLSLWLIYIASGTMLARLFKQVTVSKIAFFLSLQIIVAPLQFLAIRFLIGSFSVVSGLLVSVPMLVGVSALILLPGCMLGGLLFPLSCRLMEGEKKAIHLVYMVECIGMIIGGGIFYLLILFLNNFSLLMVSLFLVIVALSITFKQRYFYISSIVTLLFLLFSHTVFTASYSTRYRPDRLVSSGDSIYGRFDKTEIRNQKNYYYNGILIGSSADRKRAEELIGLLFLQHNNPKDVLVTGGLLQGYAADILKRQQVRQLDYLELDPLIIDTAETLLPDDTRVSLIEDDPVQYLKETERKYDIILIDMPNPTSIMLNRFYTREFFQLVSKRLKNNSSIIAVTVDKGENIILPEQAAVNGSIFGTLKTLFSNIVVMPYSDVIFVAGNGSFISEDQMELSLRVDQDMISNWYHETFVSTQMNNFRVDMLKKQITPHQIKINTMLVPTAYLYSILSWGRMVGTDVGSVVIFLKDHVYELLICMLVLFMVIVFATGSFQLNFIYYRRNFSIFSVSLSAFVVELLLLILFQMHAGYLYHVIALFTITFMAGLAAGFYISDYIKMKISRLFLIFFLMTAVIFHLSGQSFNPYVYIVVNLFAGLLEGVLLSRLLHQTVPGEKHRDITFYMLDTIGAAVGGFFVGIISFPVYGMKITILFISVLLIINIMLHLPVKRRTL